MKGFSTRRFFDSENLKKGMLITATYRNGVAKSGLISNVTPENLQFTYLEEETATFQNEEVSIDQVDNGNIVLTFAPHLTDVAGTKEQPKQEKVKEDVFSSVSLDEMLKKNFPFEKLEQFLKKQRDEAVIAFILSRLSLPQNQFAKLLFSLPDNISYKVQKKLDELNSLNPEMKKTLEDQVSKILRDYLRKQNEQSNQSNPFGGGNNPFGDLFGGGNNPLGDLFGGKGGELPEMFQDMASKLDDVLRNFFDDDNNNRRF